jgi:uncharacterized protein YmfQ (DUF2313 family)
MAAPSYSASDYLGALQALMPRGRIWPRDVSSVQAKVLAGLTKVYEAHNQRANNLLVDAFPKTTAELLPEWEATLGLTSASAGPVASVAARQALVVARLIGANGIAADDFAGYAALLGYSVTVKGNAPFRCGQSRAGAHVGAVERMFEWVVTAHALPSMPFGAYGPALLQQEMQRLAPPYGFLKFVFN